MEFLVNVYGLLLIDFLSLVLSLLSVGIHFQIVFESNLWHRCVFFISMQWWWSIVDTCLFV